MEAAKLKAKTTGGLFSLIFMEAIAWLIKTQLNWYSQLHFTYSHEKAINDDEALNKIVKKLGLSANEWGYIALPDQNKSSLNLIEVCFLSQLDCFMVYFLVSTTLSSILFSS